MLLDYETVGLLLLCFLSSIQCRTGAMRQPNDFKDNSGPPLSLFIYTQHPRKADQFRKREVPPKRGGFGPQSSHFENLVQSEDSNFGNIKAEKMSKPIVRLKNGKIVPEELSGILMESKKPAASKVFVPEGLLKGAESLLSNGPAKFEGLVKQRTSDSQPVRREVTGNLMPGMPFSFQYIVDDERTRNFQTRFERGDAQGVVRGCYQILEPEGFIRTVTYQADEDGFRVLSVTKEEDKIPCSGPGFSGNQSQHGSHLYSQRSNLSNSENKVLSKAFGSQNFYANRANQASSAKSVTSSNSYNSQTQNKIQSSEKVQQSKAESYKEKSNSLHQTQTKQNQVSYEKEYSGSNEWMSDYLNSLNELVTRAFTDVSTIKTNDNDNEFVNFPFVLIPISTYLQLRQKGVLDSNVQGFGAVVQPIPSQSQQKGIYANKKKKERVETIVRTYNTTESKKKHQHGTSKSTEKYNYKVRGGTSQETETSFNRKSQKSSSVKNSQSSFKSINQNSRSYHNHANVNGNSPTNGSPASRNFQVISQEKSQQTSHSSKNQESENSVNISSNIRQNQNNPRNRFDNQQYLSSNRNSNQPAGNYIANGNQAARGIQSSKLTSSKRTQQSSTSSKTQKYESSVSSSGNLHQNSQASRQNFLGNQNSNSMSRNNQYPSPPPQGIKTPTTGTTTTYLPPHSSQTRPYQSAQNFQYTSSKSNQQTSTSSQRQNSQTSVNYSRRNIPRSINQKEKDTKPTPSRTVLPDILKPPSLKTSNMPSAILKHNSNSPVNIDIISNQIPHQHQLKHFLATNSKQVGDEANLFNPSTKALEPRVVEPFGGSVKRPEVEEIYYYASPPSTVSKREPSTSQEMNKIPSRTKPSHPGGLTVKNMQGWTPV